ncbi:MAG: DUF1064 domain-containing protein [Methylocystis sp.]|uniref:DUF1064 domain-containing protein n=1 Tax=Methylocystis sp. TaxID=1911079 RepID=UPI003DA372AB
MAPPTEKVLQQRPAVAASVDLFLGMNQTEKRRAIELEAMKRNHQIASWRYEAVTLKLANDCRYTPDFLVINLLGQMTFEEVKGHWRDDARVKIRVAAAKFPEFAFVALRLEKGQWCMEVF